MELGQNDRDALVGHLFAVQSDRLVILGIEEGNHDKKGNEEQGKKQGKDVDFKRSSLMDEPVQKSQHAAPSHLKMEEWRMALLSLNRIKTEPFLRFKKKLIIFKRKEDRSYLKN